MKLVWCLVLLCGAVSAIEVRVEEDTEADVGDVNVRLECFVEDLDDCHWEGPFGDRWVRALVLTPFNFLNSRGRPEAK